MKLYKCLSPALVKVLENCMLRFSQHAVLDDPTEMHLAPWYKSLLPRNAVDRFTGEILDVHKKAEWMEQDFLKNLLVLCLTEKRDDTDMWARYALSHQGFLIGFNSEHSYFNKRRGPHDEWYLRKVKYRNTRPNQAKGYSVMDVVLTKGTRWESQQEWRMFRTSQEADHRVDEPDAPYPIYLFRFPPEAVVEVILGCRISEENRKVICGIVKNSSHFHHVSLLETYFVDDDYQLRFKDITL